VIAQKSGAEQEEFFLSALTVRPLDSMPKTTNLMCLVVKSIAVWSINFPPVPLEQLTNASVAAVLMGQVVPADFERPALKGPKVISRINALAA